MSVQQMFVVMREDMAASLIEREEEIDVVLTALICQEHPLLVGPPGTAKSLLLDTVLRWLGPGATKFSILFGKYTVPEEVFGPVSIQGLKADVYRRVTTNKLPEAVGAFADEIFKPSTAILNTLLRILNERVYENGDGTFRTCPLRICVAASNEWPADNDGGKELGALFDRFLFRKTVRPVSKAGRSRLLWERNHTPHLRTTISQEELDQACGEANDMDWTDDARKALDEILDTQVKEGIHPGDRRQYKSILAAQAYAYLCGADMVRREHLEILAHVLWDDPTEHPQKCAKVVAKIANPTGHLITEKLLQVQDVLAKCSPTEAVPKLKEIQKELLA
ncbi:MAG: AAA family ATPase, partial [bacterium]